MESTKTQKQTVLKYVVHVGRTAIVALFIFSMASALHPGLRKHVRHHFSKQFRTVLSTAQGSFISEGSFKVVKIETAEGLMLEIYDESKGTVKPLVDRIYLPDKKDGFILFRGQATNLAIDDVNGDKIPDIIAPTFDKNLVAHMNVYTFNKTTKRFEKLSGETAQ